MLEGSRGRIGQISGVRITATGSYVPQEIVTNEDLAELGCDSEWIVRRTGIRERRRAAEDEATSDLCFQAAQRCMEKAGITAADIDLILVATITPDHPTLQRLATSKDDLEPSLQRWILTRLVQALCTA